MTANRGFLLVPSIFPDKPYLYKNIDIATFNVNNPPHKQRINVFRFSLRVLKTIKSRQRIKKAFGNLVKLFVP